MANSKKTRQTRQYIQLMDAAKKSILTAIDTFNRVHGEYKTETTLMLLSNGWELLAKAVLVKKKKSIYKDKAKKETISCEQAINQLLNLKEIDSNAAHLLQQIISLRNKCCHDVLPPVPDEIQHHLLFFGCKLFKELATKHFPKTEKDLSRNFLTISFDQLTTYAAEVQNLVSKLRKGTQGEKELMWLLERGIRYTDSNKYISQKEFEKLYKEKKKITPHLKICGYIEGADMVRVVPVQAPQNFTADIQLRKGSNKLKGTLPVTVKKSNPEEDYPYLTSDIAKKIGKPGNTNFVAKAMTGLGLKGNDQYHQAIKVSSKGEVQRYSQAALDKLKDHINTNPGYNPYQKAAA